MRTPEYATRRFFPRVSSSLRAGFVLVVHSLVGVSPYLHASQSNFRHPWPTIDFLRVLTFLFVPTDDTNADTLSTEDRFLL